MRNADWSNKKAHEIGHFGVIKTVELIRKEYWSEKLKDNIESYIHNRVPCILRSKKQGRKEDLKLKEIIESEAQEFMNEREELRK